MDDGSSDDTLAIAKSWTPALRVCHQDNAGPSAARNRGIAMAEGEYLAFIDADDTWLPGRLMHVNVIACGIFGTVSGSSAATCATIAKVALPELVKRGYDEKTALGSLCGARPSPSRKSASNASSRTR